MPKSSLEHKLCQDKNPDGDTISDDDESDNTSAMGGESEKSAGPQKVSLLTFLVTVLAAIAVGLSAGKAYGPALLASEAEVAPQCASEETNSSSVDAASSSLSQKLAFRFAKVEKEEEEDDDDDEEDDKEEEDNNPFDTQIYELHIHADGLEDLFDDYDEGEPEDNISEFLEDMMEASDACEEIFTLKGHFTMEPKKHGGKPGTVEVLGMLEDGHFNIITWPEEGKMMANFQINPPRKHGEESVVTEMKAHACIDSIAKFLYPDDVVKADGIEGSIDNVSHLTQMGPFDVLTKYGKDPLRFRWWTAQGRGFRKMDPNEYDISAEFGDFGGWSHLVKSVQSPFQRIDIVDAEDDYDTMPMLKYFTDPKYAEEKKYIEAHRAFFSPDRSLYLDGVIQSTWEGLAPYHEALVQPAMFTHPNPKRVGIVGGGECATLRETLKHNTVETVVMVEIDPIIVEVSKTFLPEWNDCSMFEGSSRYCMDDPRVEMYHLDALKWFRDRFSEEARLEGNEFYGTEEKFDVVILDALDPQNAVDFVEALYGDGPFMNSLYNSLTEDGVLLTQVGEAIYIGDQAETYPKNFNYQRYMYESGLKNQGFKVIFNYEEPRAGFDGIWSFYAAFKSDTARARWQMNAAQFDLEIQKRSIRRVGPEVESGEIKGIMDYFDGPTMATYRYPSKDAQVIFCQRDPKPYLCTADVRDAQAIQKPINEPNGFDPEIPNLSAENFSVTESGDLVSRVDAPEKSYLMLEQSVHDVQVTPSTSAILQSEDSVYGESIAPVTNFVASERGGLTMPRRGATYSTYRVDCGKLNFLGHGCEGSFNAESLIPTSVTEATANPDTIPEDDLLERSYSNKVVKELIFNPSHTRNTHLPEFVMSSGKISSGEGITSNFVPWYNDAGWKGHIEALKSKCSSSDSTNSSA